MTRTAITTIEAAAGVLARSDVDTDLIIPARFLKYPVTNGYANFLFHDLRQDDDGRPNADFVLNRVPQLKILLAGPNFGCGSSREGAVQALQHYGVRAIIAESFGPIFENNCFKNGLLPIRLNADRMQHLFGLYGSGGVLTVDLPAREVRDCGGNSHPFDMDDFWHGLLMQGGDTLDITLTMLDAVRAFESQRLRDQPWLIPYNHLEEGRA